MSEVRFTREFIRATKKENVETIRAACEEIAENPYTARGSHRLSHDWSGFRAADFAKSKRIIYRVCDECVRLRQQSQTPLDCCEIEDPAPDFLTFVDFGDYHSNAGRRRLRPSPQYRVDTDSNE
jgi:mRNA-degrading endonuclease YafQ of YafQ-DinJ toxin-antitoxin module